MDDLITRLTAAIDKTERNGFLGQSPLGYVTADKVYLPTEVQFVYYSEDVTARQAVLRGCEPDRKILALHQPIETFAGMTEFYPEHAGTPGFPIRTICELCADHDSERGWDDQDEDVQYPCPTLRAVAERYGLEDTSG